MESLHLHSSQGPKAKLIVLATATVGLLLTEAPAQEWKYGNEAGAILHITRMPDLTINGTAVIPTETNKFREIAVSGINNANGLSVTYENLFDDKSTQIEYSLVPTASTPKYNGYAIWRTEDTNVPESLREFRLQF